MSYMKNYMEELVLSMMKDVLKSMDVCQCEKCRADIAAIALNSLPTYYVVTDIGELYTKVNALRQQFEVDIIAAITKGVEIVKNNPRHVDV